ncbi:hypothetical protein PICMEDRAFT_17758 [Pichia membranifaciens NRRL Y-2026]|uniref:Vacuolar import/degradation Vid27 C-terminal domain-containing protein n=1 Tax=Pichia membranifaciens NRRL Y-2026 TaxID=763406 RepID=A0A1E3NGM9_9ASCO|nr:hypothetical protein PICMEDRAFT_17758 [Pichia membranifaciens NRRL Y-2026]ODQ45274.1 hypothetical protein PICMEDRAFT_17758 [Pichia membranifaciens NRRL Y-2026]
MNIVKRFFMNHNKYPTDESSMIPSGQLYLLRSPSSPKSENECLYNDAILTVRETNHQFDYQLVVWKGNPSDSESSSDDDNGDSDVNDNFFENESNVLKSFLIDSSLNLCLFERYSQKIISWRDMEGDLGDMFEYRITSTVPNDTIEQFMTAIYKCKYERKYQKSSANLSLKDVQEFIVDRNQLFDNCLNSANTPSISSNLNMDELLTPKRNIEDEVEFAEEGESDDEEDELEERVEHRNLSYNMNATSYEDEEEDENNFVDASESPQTAIFSVQKTNRVLIRDFPCKVYSYSAEAQAFESVSNQSLVLLYELSNWNYCFEVREEDNSTIYAVSLINDQLDPTFKFEQFAFLFNLYTKTSATTWLLKFEDRTTYEGFQATYMKLHWQNRNETTWPTRKEDEQYLIDSLDMMDIDDDLSQADEETEDSDSEQPEVEDITGTSSFKFKGRKKYVDLDDSDESDDENEREFNKVSKNSGLVLGLSTDRAFISRANKIGIFKTTDSGIEFTAAINKLSHSRNAKKELIPSKMMLMDNDRTMIVQDKSAMNSLHKVDLEYGRVVEDWKLEKDDKDVNVENFTTNRKFGDLAADMTFLGVSSQSLFRVDPRMSAGFVSDDAIKAYKGKTNFKQVSTTGGGYIAVASKNGEIRLYDQLGKNAKTLLPALGDEIIGLDISANGRWLLATCASYILLIDVQIKDGKFEGKLGFERSFSVKDKPMPRRLNLKPEHMAYVKQRYGLQTSFSIAAFNETSEGGSPTYIVSSIGPFAVTWNFLKVISNVRDCYKIRMYQENVVISEFVNHNNNHMVLALPDNVALASTSSFKRPSDEFSVVKTAF